MKYVSGCSLLVSQLQKNDTSRNHLEFIERLHLHVFNSFLPSPQSDIQIVYIRFFSMLATEETGQEGLKHTVQVQLAVSLHGNKQYGV